MKNLTWIFATLLLGCATVIGPNEGHTSDETRARLEKQQQAATEQAAFRAIEAADAAPENLRAQRKAAQLAREQLGNSKSSSALYSAIQPTLKRLEQHSDACSVLIEAGRVHNVAKNVSAAAEDFVSSVRSCGNLDGLREASYVLKDLGRCGELVKLASGVWPSAKQEEWVRIMDSVRICSDRVSLRRNLSFVPADVQEEYFGLLAQREQQERKLNCESHCYSSRQSCESGCWNSSACYSYCASVESACLAGCS